LHARLTERAGKAKESKEAMSDFQPFRCWLFVKLFEPQRHEDTKLHEGFSLQALLSL
jgi:hypothetical protein